MTKYYCPHGHEILPPPRPDYKPVKDDQFLCTTCQKSYLVEECAQRTLVSQVPEEAVNHPEHYGGDTPYEAIKVIEAWQLNFNLGNTVKYVSRAGKKGALLEDLKKAAWYLAREISNLESK